MRLRKRLRRGLGKIARKLGSLARLVQLRCILRGRIRQAGHTAIPVAAARQSDQFGFAEGDRLRGSQRIQQLLKDEWKPRTLLAEQPQQMVCCFLSLAFERTTEPARLAAQFNIRVRYAIDLTSCDFVADQIALDIDVAELAGSLAKLLQQADRIAGLKLVRRKLGKHGEQFELGLNATGGRAQAMDRNLSRPGEAELDRCLERRDGLAKELHWVRRLICLGHGTWMPASLPRMKEKRRPMKDRRYLFLPFKTGTYS